MGNVEVLTSTYNAFSRKCPSFTIQDDDTYRLGSDYHGITALRGHNFDTPYCSIMPHGLLLLRSGFVWDGPSGPAVDTAKTLMPSALHDCLYRMIEDGWLPPETREAADYTYRDALKTWGVPFWRRALHFRAVRLFGGFHIKK